MEGLIPSLSWWNETWHIVPDHYLSNVTCDIVWSQSDIANKQTLCYNWLTELNPKLGSKLLSIYLFFKSLPQLQWKCRNVIETNSTPTIKVEKQGQMPIDAVVNKLL